MSAIGEPNGEQQTQDEEVWLIVSAATVGELYERRQFSNCDIPAVRCTRVRASGAVTVWFSSRRGVIVSVGRWVL